MSITSPDSPYFQDYMQGNICFGCGNENPEGLHIKSEWQGEESVCQWSPEEKYNGWKGLLNGGMIGVLVDCHCMCTAMAVAYKQEGRALDSFPAYRYATGTLTVKYLKPTPIAGPIELRAVVEEIKGKKITLRCDIYAGGEKTAEAQAVALRVYDSSRTDNLPAFSH